MRVLRRGLIAVGVTACAAVTASADSVRLTNGDTIVGAVVSLDESQLVLQSENFGEMKIPRDKVEVIGLGDAPLAKVIPGGAVPAASDEMPSMQNPQIRQQVDRLLQQALGGGVGGIGNMGEQMESTRKGLQELQQDLGPGSSADALDGYIRLFEMFGGSGAGVPSEPSGVERPAGPSTPPASPNDDQ